jgi:hypothetical protein
MPIIIIVGVIVLWAAIRVGGLFVRRAFASWCRRACAGKPPWLRGWMERQGAWSFDEAWKRLWAHNP